MRNVEVEIRGEQVGGVIAFPEPNAGPDSGTGPGVIVIQEWWGLVPHIQGVVSRLAAAGFVALALDHYRGVETTEPDEAQKLMMGLQVSAAAADLAGAAAYLVDRPEVTTSKIAVMGFCMGGGLALLAPTVSAQIACAAAFYPAMPWPDFAPDWANYAGKAALVQYKIALEVGGFLFSFLVFFVVVGQLEKYSLESMKADGASSFVPSFFLLSPALLARPRNTKHAPACIFFA